MAVDYKKLHTDNAKLTLASAALVGASGVAVASAPIVASVTFMVGLASGVYHMGRSIYLWKRQFQDR